MLLTLTSQHLQLLLPGHLQGEGTLGKYLTTRIPRPSSHGFSRSLSWPRPCEFQGSSFFCILQLRLAAGLSGLSAPCCLSPWFHLDSLRGLPGMAYFWEAVPSVSYCTSFKKMMSVLFKVFSQDLLALAQDLYCLFLGIPCCSWPTMEGGTGNLDPLLEQCFQNACHGGIVRTVVWKGC